MVEPSAIKVNDGIQVRVGGEGDIDVKVDKVKNTKKLKSYGFC